MHTDNTSITVIPKFQTQKIEDNVIVIINVCDSKYLKEEKVLLLYLLVKRLAFLHCP